ncbi:MAG: AAA family ATPase [Planctomycetes bacterium]|nr:AAA family ATPase [Planctomycetota bacterium]
MAIRAAVGEPSKVFGYERHCDWLHTRGAADDLLVTFTTPGGEFSVRATPPAGPAPLPDQLGTRRWTFQVTPPAGPELDRALRDARSLVFFHLDATELARPSYSERIPPRVEFNGSGLASVLSYMALNDPDGFDTLLLHMKNFIPHLKRIRFNKVMIRRSETAYFQNDDESEERFTTRKYQADVLLFDFNNANNVAAYTVSEGTILLLGLLTILLGPTQPKILLLDDIEHGLHPLAQKSLLDALKQVMGAFPDLQIIASAHSPWLLDQLQPEQIRLMTLDADGYAVCGKLTDHPQFEKWKEEMAPGELWSLFGEKWLVEGGATE